MSVRDRIKRMEQMAMQEKEAAPDERGRSPGGRSMASNNSASGSPRPLSKVRTSFVAIADKEGRLGLHRQHSGDSSIYGRKLSGDTDAGASTSSLLLDNSSTTSNNSRPNVFSSSPDAIRAERARGQGPLPRATVPDAGPGPAAAEAAGAAADQTVRPAEHAPAPYSGSAGPVTDSKAATPAEASKPTEAPESHTVPGAAESGPLADPQSAEFDGSVLAKPAGRVSGRCLAPAQEQQGLAASPEIKKASRDESGANQRASGGTGGADQGQGVEESKAQLARDQAQASNARSQNAGHKAGDGASASPPKGNGVSVASAGGVAPALKAANKAKTIKPAPASSAPAKPAGKAPGAKGSRTPSVEKKPTETKTAQSYLSPSFIKPRPKSPTQPVKLPERLTTHTAASATRTKNGAPPSNNGNRPASSTSGKSLGQSSSVTGRQHSSFGPPPKPAGDQAPFKEVKPVDESFLARMMRPTQAYANKVTDKAQHPPKTPPRSVPVKKPATARNGPATKGPTSATASAAASPERTKSEQSLAVKPSAEVAKAAAEKASPAAKENVPEAAEKKDDPLTAFMNGGSKKVDVSEANGEHGANSKDSSALVSGKDTAQSVQPSGQPEITVFAAYSQPEPAKEEEWSAGGDHTVVAPL